MKPARWTMYVAMGLLVFFSVMFFTVFAIITIEEAATNREPATPDVELDTVLALLEDADPAHGESLIETYQCTACHITAAGVGVAPPFAGLADRAAARRPPLTATEYIYESIVTPRAYVVEGFADSMPGNFAQRLSAEDLGDVIAYLMIAE